MSNEITTAQEQIKHIDHEMFRLLGKGAERQRKIDDELLNLRMERVQMFELQQERARLTKELEND